nr:hypothetical protein [Lachnospiraceae bacterium]
MKRKLIALILSAAMVLSTTTVALAEVKTCSTDDTVEGDVTDGLSVNNGAEVTVNGDVSNEDGSTANAVAAYGEGTKVTVNGNVTDTASQEGYGINAGSGAKVTVDGNVTSSGGEGINVSGDTTVNVTKNVSGEKKGIVIEGSSGEVGTVTVDGDVTGAVLATNGNVTTGSVTGNGNSDSTISESEDSTIKVNGNVKAGESEAAIKTDGGSTIVVTGTIDSGDEAAIVFDHSNLDESS